MTLKNIEFLGMDGERRTAEISGFPDKCPACNHGMKPRFHGGYQIPDRLLREAMVLVFQCPLDRCGLVFLGFYSAAHKLANYFVLNKSYLPFVIEKPPILDRVADISKRFAKAYAHAHFAEQNGLSEVCGCGYRRALELLVKDYLIKLSDGDDEKIEQIKKKFLGQCIEDDIDDSRIKSVAKRAAWLGNDETHYVRKWEDQDIKNLKQLIELTVYWIDAEQSTRNYEEGMPE